MFEESIRISQIHPSIRITREEILQNGSHRKGPHGGRGKPRRRETNLCDNESPYAVN